MPERLYNFCDLNQLKPHLKSKSSFGLAAVHSSACIPSGSPNVSPKQRRLQQRSISSVFRRKKGNERPLCMTSHGVWVHMHVPTVVHRWVHAYALCVCQLVENCEWCAVPRGENVRKELATNERVRSMIEMKKHGYAPGRDSIIVTSCHEAGDSLLTGTKQHGGMIVANQTGPRANNDRTEPMGTAAPVAWRRASLRL